MNILHIDSSILGEHSVSRRLSAAIVEQLVSTAPGADVTYRDLAREPIPQFSGAFAKAAGSAPPDLAAPPSADFAIAERAFDEVQRAQIIVIGAPMYNFSIPSQLKSWLDAIALPGKAFSYDENGPKGLLGGKRVIIASARGGLYSPGTPAAAVEHHESYLLALLGFLGITDIEVVRAEGVKMGPEHAQSSISGALAHARSLKAA